MRDDLTPPVDAEKLLPHRRPLRLVDRLTHADEAGAEVEAVVPVGSPLAEEDGTLAAVVPVELMAQAYAAMKGWQDMVAGRPVKKGFLVGIRTVRLRRPARAGELLTIAVRTTGAIEWFAMAEAQVRGADGIVAEGVLKLYLPEDTSAAGGGK